jgi:hypothetical protein
VGQETTSGVSPGMDRSSQSVATGFQECRSGTASDREPAGRLQSSEGAVCKDPLGTTYRRLPTRTAAVNRHGAGYAAEDRSRRSPPLKKEAEMSRYRRILIGLAVVGASFIPSAAASALGGNHNETLLLDD